MHRPRSQVVSKTSLFTGSFFQRLFEEAAHLHDYQSILDLNQEGFCNPCFIILFSYFPLRSVELQSIRVCKVGAQSYLIDEIQFLEDLYLVTAREAAFSELTLITKTCLN